LKGERMSNELFQLTASTLAKLDRGAAAKALDTAIAAAVHDCLDRPTDERARKITLTLELAPIKEVIGNVISCEGASGKFKVRYRQPDWESLKLDFGVRENGMLVFAEMSPANHQQPTLFDREEEDDDQ
jgi:hypothetical protein